MPKLFESKRPLSQKTDLVFETTFKRYFDSLYNYGIKMNANEDVVKDSIQEVFFRIWKNGIDLSEVEYPKTYLMQALRRQILNTLDLKYSRIIKIKLESNIAFEFSHEDYWIQNQEEKELQEKVVNALNGLSNKQREAVYLRYFEDLSFDEIAKIMDINLQSVKNNVHRGLSSLRENMSLFLFMVFILKLN
jgi:RNA polymerase sigma factor (sigma-70 family)